MVAKQQHYVPQFLLRRWCVGNTESINVLDKTTRKIFLANPRDVGGEQFFYSHLPEGQVLEKWFTDLEGKASSLCNRIERARTVSEFTDLERFDLCQFITASLVRTRETREEVTQLSEGFANTIARKMNVTDWEYRLTEDGALVHHINIFPEIPKFALMLMNLQSVVEVNETDLPLTTSDHPVVRYNDLPPRPGGGGRFGFKSRGVQFHMPISPRTCLQLLHPGAYGFLPSEWILSDVQNVVFERWLQLDQSYRHEFSRSDDDFRTELSILDENPDIGHPGRQRFRLD